MDLDYTKQIRIQMNVPERILPVKNSQHHPYHEDTRSTAINEQMNIPDRLMVTDHRDSYLGLLRDQRIYKSFDDDEEEEDDFVENLKHEPTYTNNSNQNSLGSKSMNSININKKKVKADFDLRLERLEKRVMDLERRSSSSFRREVVLYPLLIGLILFQLSKHIASK